MNVHMETKTKYLITMADEACWHHIWPEAAVPGKAPYMGGAGVTMVMAVWDTWKHM